MRYVRTSTNASYHMTMPSWMVKIRTTTESAYIRQSRDTGHQSKYTICNHWKKKLRLPSCEKEIYRKILTLRANNPQHAGTAKILKTADPTMVPTPKSLFVTNVPTTLMNNSELEAAAAINVPPTIENMNTNLNIWFFPAVERGGSAERKIFKNILKFEYFLRSCQYLPTSSFRLKPLHMPSMAGTK